MFNIYMYWERNPLICIVLNFSSLHFVGQDQCQRKVTCRVSSHNLGQIIRCDRHGFSLRLSDSLPRHLLLMAAYRQIAIHPITYQNYFKNLMQKKLQSISVESVRDNLKKWICEIALPSITLVRGQDDN